MVAGALVGIFVGSLIDPIPGDELIIGIALAGYLIYAGLKGIHDVSTKTITPIASSVQQSLQTQSLAVSPSIPIVGGSSLISINSVSEVRGVLPLSSTVGLSISGRSMSTATAVSTASGAASNICSPRLCEPSLPTFGEQANFTLMLAGALSSFFKANMKIKILEEGNSG